jgi:hypothetical protein
MKFWKKFNYLYLTWNLWVLTLIIISKWQVPFIFYDMTIHNGLMQKIIWREYVRNRTANTF